MGQGARNVSSALIASNAINTSNISNFNGFFCNLLKVKIIDT